MTCIADANVLFPLLVQGHAAHEAARAWWNQQADAAVGTCLLTRLAVLRLLSNKVAMNGVPVSPDEALKAWRRLGEDPRTFHIDTPPAEHESRFVSFVASREPASNLWTDAWLAALAASLDCEMTTFDRGFRAFRGLKLQLLQLTDR
ncbi:MAG TPA: TA system VapC family ribonuclease toxin [Steroidobacteraceae bacterium]|nr:TA system VapC family ribonuclease toxin [Steroidobacteraceae bacterium]